MALSKDIRQRAGHYEILGETLAKFEFFEAGWNPYQRYLDVDKVDFILRARANSSVTYREVQVKYGKLYDCGYQWEQPLFDVTSWRFFREGEFNELRGRKDFFLAYVMAHDSGYSGDIFIFPIDFFSDLLRRAVKSGDKRTVRISRSIVEKGRWYFRLKAKFDRIDDQTCVDVTSFRRNFSLLSAEPSLVDRSDRFIWNPEDIQIQSKKAEPNQALQTTSVARSGLGKVSVSDRQKRGV